MCPPTDGEMALGPVHGWVGKVLVTERGDAPKFRDPVRFREDGLGRLYGTRLPRGSVPRTSLSAPDALAAFDHPSVLGEVVVDQGARDAQLGRQEG
jgi:hypothetical protein